MQPLIVTLLVVLVAFVLFDNIVPEKQAEEWLTPYVSRLSAPYATSILTSWCEQMIREWRDTGPRKSCSKTVITSC